MHGPGWTLGRRERRLVGHPSYVRRLVREGRLEARKEGRRLLIHREALNTYLTSLNPARGAQVKPVVGRLAEQPLSAWRDHG